jgi:uncharacterized protein (DUF2252 family)
MRDAVEEYMNFNRPFAQRSPELLRLKTTRMVESPFAFFRGTFHLFARDVLDRSLSPLAVLRADAPELDLVGDLHSENYGTYKASDGVIHYDVNDFDETTTGRFDFDVSRLAVSHFLASRERDDALADAVHTTLAGIIAYAETVRSLVKKGPSHDLDFNEQALTGCPAIDHLIQAGAAAKRPDFINKLTQCDEGKRKLRRSLHYFNLPDDERARALRLLADYLKHRKESPPTKDYYHVEDVCGRVAGIGSMGRYRFAVLIAGKGSADARNVLLEFKESRPSAYDLYRNRDTNAAALKARAERVITMQRESQAGAGERLGFAVDGDLSFQVREIGPPDARVDARSLKTATLLADVARIQGKILARIHARAVRRVVGAANPLSELEDTDSFAQRVLAFALGYSSRVRQDYNRFVGARAELDDVSAWSSLPTS